MKNNKFFLTGTVFLFLFLSIQFCVYPFFSESSTVDKIQQKLQKKVGIQARKLERLVARLTPNDLLVGWPWYEDRDNESYINDFIAGFRADFYYIYIQESLQHYTAQNFMEFRIRGAEWQSLAQIYLYLRKDRQGKRSYIVRLTFTPQSQGSMKLMQYGTLFGEISYEKSSRNMVLESKPFTIEENYENEARDVMYSLQLMASAPIRNVLNHAIIRSIELIRVN